jgi:hypothetical protein
MWPSHVNSCISVLHIYVDLHAIVGGEEREMKYLMYECVLDHLY